MVPHIVCCWFTLAWDDSSSSCTVWQEIIMKRCTENEHCRLKQILAPKPHNWCANVSTQSWGILLWIPSQWCTPTRTYHRFPDERITSCPLLAVGKRCPKNWQRTRWCCLRFHWQTHNTSYTSSSIWKWTWYQTDGQPTVTYTFWLLLT